MPAIAPPLNPLSLGALIPSMGDPSVDTGVSNACVVVGFPVSVTVDKPSLVPRTGGVAVAVAQIEELPTIHWLPSHTSEGPQQVLPQRDSPIDESQLPEPEPEEPDPEEPEPEPEFEPPAAAAVGAGDRRALHVVVYVAASVSLTVQVEV